MRGGKPAAAAVGFAAFWVTVEYVLAMISVHSTFGNLGYTQMNFLPILQLAALTGIWGISFCLMLFAATLAALCSGYGSSREKGVLAVGVAIFLLAILGFGEWRLHAPQKAEWVSVGLLASGKFTVGNSRTTLQQPSGLRGVTICKDMDFPGLSREYGRDGVGLLLVPAWDFDADGWLRAHGNFARR
jgi:apolipoprotein N-acyltransferase